MTNELIIEYGLVDHLDVYVSGQLQLAKVHWLRAACYMSLTVLASTPLVAGSQPPAFIQQMLCMLLQKPNRATAAQLKEFHTGEYIQFLERAKPETVTEQEVEHFNVIEDSPIFDGVFQFCQIYAGASIHGAQKLIQDDYDIAINWSGGLHHAKKGQAEGIVHLHNISLTLKPGRHRCLLHNGPGWSASSTAKLLGCVFINF